MNTAEQEALSQIKETLLPHVGEQIDQFCQLFADVPDTDLEPAIYGGLGNLLVKTIEQTSPQISEAMRWSLSYAVCDLLRERMRSVTP
jgi:hypothetical protein